MLSYSSDSWFTEVLDVFPDYIGKVCVRGGPGIEISETCPLWDARCHLILLMRTNIFDVHSRFHHFYIVVLLSKTILVSNRRIAPSGTRVGVGSIPMKRPRQGDAFQVLDKRSEKWVRAII